MIATTIGGLWFAALGSDGEVGLFTSDGYEIPSYPEQLALRHMLIGASDADD